MARGVSEAFAVAEKALEMVSAESAESKGVIRRKDGFTLAYLKLGGRHILVWFRQTPITSKAVRYMERVVRRIRHDEVWLVKLYLDPDYDESYTKYINRVFQGVDEFASEVRVMENK